MSITVMKQALEALEDPISFAKGHAAITALRTAITEAEKQEPVACRHEWFSTGAMEPNVCRCIHCGKWGNTTPPAARREWVDLTDEDIESCYGGEINDFARAVIDKFKGKNT